MSEATKGRTVMSYLAAALLVFIAWHLLALALDRPAVPGPVPALTAFRDGISADLGGHLLASAGRVLASILLAVATALPAGLLLGRNRLLGDFAAPLIYLTYPVPKIVFLPVLIIILGIGDLSKITLISIIVFFQILITTWDAARGINPHLTASIVSLGAGEWDLYRHVYFPAVLPKMFTALRIASGTAVAVLFFAETVATNVGLGYYILDAWSRYAYEVLFAGVIAMGLLGFALYLLIEAAERLACPWQRRGAGAENR